jgi:hypothetical protein
MSAPPLSQLRRARNSAQSREHRRIEAKAVLTELGAPSCSSSTSHIESRSCLLDSKPVLTSPGPERTDGSQKRVP